MDEIFGSLAKYFGTRVRTQIYGLFTFWLFILHWQFFYTLLFVSQDLIYKKTGLLKNVYLKCTYGNVHSLNFWVYVVVTVIVSASLTYLMIWIMPQLILERAYEKEQKDKAQRLKIKLKYEQDIKDEKTKLEKKLTALEEQTTKRLVATEKKVDTERKVQEKEKDLTSDWQLDYNKFATSNLYKRFDEFIACLYQHGGQTHIEDPTFGSIIFELNKDMLAYADSNNLVSYDRSKGYISLTDKGKYFVKTYQDSKS